MRNFFFLTLVAVLCGCALPNSALEDRAQSDLNIERLGRVSVGMSQKEVLAILRKPYSYECFMIKNDTYDVWFYLTTPTILGQSHLVHHNLTPLAFKNGVLIGWGYRYYNYYVEESQNPESEMVPEEIIPSPDSDVTMSFRTKKQPTAASVQEYEEDEDEYQPSQTQTQQQQKKQKQEKEEPPPDKSGRDMLYDDAEDDFNNW